MGSEPKIDRLDKDDLKTLCCAAATMLADKEDEITMLRAQLAAAEARVVELEGSVRRLVEEELPLLRVRRWRDMNVEDKNPMPFKKAESERTGHMVPDPLGGWVSAPMIQTKLMRLLETPND